MSKKMRSLLIVVAVVFIVAVVVTFGLMSARMFYPLNNVYRDEWWCILSSNWVDFNGEYTLEPQQYTSAEKAVLTVGSRQYCLYFDCTNPEENFDKDFYLVPYTEDETTMSRDNALAHGGWEYDSKEDLLILWLNDYESIKDKNSSPSIVLHRVDR